MACYQITSYNLVVFVAGECADLREPDAHVRLHSARCIPVQSRAPSRNFPSPSRRTDAMGRRASFIPSLVLVLWSLSWPWKQSP